MRLIVKAAAAGAAAVLGVTLGAAPAAGSSLTVAGYCESGNGVDPWRHFGCFASVAGGVGGYTFSWQVLTPNTAYLTYVQGELSEGQCLATNSATVRVTVVSGSETASDDVRFNCPYHPY